MTSMTFELNIWLTLELQNNLEIKQLIKVHQKIINHSQELKEMQIYLHTMELKYQEKTILNLLVLCQCNIGSSPWQNVKYKNEEEQYKAIGLMKLRISSQELCQDLPIEFMKFVDLVKKYRDKPDYKYLQQYIEKIRKFN